MVTDGVITCSIIHVCDNVFLSIQMNSRKSPCVLGRPWLSINKSQLPHPVMIFNHDMRHYSM